MNLSFRAAAIAVVGLTAASAVAQQEQGPAEVELRYRTVREGQFELPSPESTNVATAFDFRATVGLSFAVESNGTGIRVDTDGDGVADVDVDGKEGSLTLRGERPTTGQPFQYAVRLQNQGGGWRFTSAGSLIGKIGNTKITLLDQNNNGSFADVGVDAMVVGRAKQASFLSEAVAVGDQLYAIEIDESLGRLRFSPWAGDIGTLDLASDLEAKGKLLSAIVISADRKHSFELSGGATPVPPGVYRLHAGKLGLGSAELGVRQGGAADLVVSAGRTVALDWGGPARAEFAYQRKGDQLILSPDQVWYFGDAGEEYFGWNPVGKSPEFFIESDGEVIATAIFPGSC